jgi:simple sugar transport system ATP-binding protein
VTLQNTDVPIGSLSGGQRQSVAVVLISHNMPEVLSVSDRIEVLRLGKRVARFDGAGTKLEDLVAAMSGAHAQEEAA